MSTYVSESSSPSATRSLLSQIRAKTSLLSFRPTRRTVTDFHISLDDPHRVYSPTDLVAGSVCITVERPLAITHLTVALVGCVDISTSTRETSSRKRRKPEWSVGGGGGLIGPIRGDGNGLNFCRDEVVLCGEGRLEPGLYKFEFELEFRKIPGVGGGLPTSIDFEKGSISYVTIAALTRPTAVHPTVSCSAKVSMMEPIDIALYPRPKARVIRLDPTNRTPRRSSSKASSVPTPSSAPCSPTLGVVADHAPAEIKRSKGPIIATVELLNAGALRGETIAVKVSIQHTKKIKSLNGIILTLMRQTRFDPEGALDSDDISCDQFKKNKAALPPTYRKDLAQTICPLFVDPRTLTTVVRSSLRIPNDVFPTITDVPGGSVEFRYWVEIVMDLGGKLNNRDGLFNALAPGSPGPNVNIKSEFFDNDRTSDNRNAGGTGRALSVEGGVMIETERVRRRDKSVVSCKFEVVIGSVDSVGKKGRLMRQTSDFTNLSSEPVRESTAERTQVEQQREPQQHHSHNHAVPGYDAQWRETVLEPVDMKTRMRLAEERLLPSSPPVVAGSSSSASAPLEPSAPDLSHELHVSFALDRRAEGEDKAERERQRLLERESSPPGIDEDLGGGGINATAPDLQIPLPQPQVPIRSGSNSGDNERGGLGEDEMLPEYQR